MLISYAHIICSYHILNISLTSVHIISFIILYLSYHVHNKHNSRWERAQELLIADPSISKTIGSSYGSLPLLTAVMNKPPLTLVQSLIAANPGKTFSVSAYDSLPSYI